MACTDFAASCRSEGAWGITVGNLRDVHIHVERKAEKKACGLMFSTKAMFIVSSAACSECEACRFPPFYWPGDRRTFSITFAAVH